MEVGVKSAGRSQQGGERLGESGGRGEDKDIFTPVGGRAKMGWTLG